MGNLSQQEVQRLRVIEKAVDGRLSVREAARLLQRSERQVQRLKQRCQASVSGDAAWVQHGNRNRAKPWAVPDALRQRVLDLARTRYRGFNDSHFQEKLAACEGIGLSRETVRRILREAKLASPQKRRRRPYRARRERRPRLGMMLLTDASRHAWLEDRGPQLTLLGLQDDATGLLLAARFQLEAENAVGYFHILDRVIREYGVPLSLYRDRHGIFQRNDQHWTREEELAGHQTPTHLGRALQQLGIQQIPAHSPQAKGRIERLWRSFQDRLRSELRLAHASTLDDANTVLARFLPAYNAQFAVPAREAASDFRRLPRGFDLARCLSFQYQRVVAPDHTLRFGSETLQLPPTSAGRGYPGATVQLCHQLDGHLRVYRSSQPNAILLLDLDRPLQQLSEPRPAAHTSAAQRNAQKATAPRKMPRIYTLGGRPALAAVT